MKRHILDHLLALFQLALPPRSDIPDAASVGNTSKVDAETDRDPLDEGFDLIDAEYMDQEYVHSLLSLEDSIPAASEDDVPFTRPTEYIDHATNPLLRNFVRSAMIVENPTNIPDIRSFVSTATRTMIDLVVMILDGLGALVQLNEQQERLNSRLRKLLHALRSYLKQLSNDPVASVTALLTTTQARESESSFSLLHKTLWASAHELDMVSSRKEISREYELEDLEDMITTVDTCLDDILRELRDVFGAESEAGRADVSEHADLVELRAKIQLGPGMDFVDLNLTHPNREVIYRGDLLRKGPVEWVETHAILFDHYMVLAETSFVQAENSWEFKVLKYGVSNLPIPMVLLVLEGANDDPIVDGIGAVATATEAPTKTTLWPFRLKHLGRNQPYYTLAASTSQIRQVWCTGIVEAKRRHAISLYEQNAEPFRLRVMARALAFGPMPTYNVIPGDDMSTTIQGTPLYRALQDLEEQYKDAGPRPRPCRAPVNCVTTFLDPYVGGPIVVLGTDYGVYISNYNTPRAWKRVSS